MCGKKERRDLPTNSPPQFVELLWGVRGQTPCWLGKGAGQGFVAFLRVHNPPAHKLNLWTALRVRGFYTLLARLRHVDMLDNTSCYPHDHSYDGYYVLSFFGLGERAYHRP